LARLPRPLVVEVVLGDQSDEPLVVVPVGDDVHSTGHHDHPGYGLVEGEVLVQQTLYLPWRTLQGRGGEGRGGGVPRGVCRYG